MTSACDFGEKSQKVDLRSRSRIEYILHPYLLDMHYLQLTSAMQSRSKHDLNCPFLPTMCSIVAVMCASNLHRAALSQ